MSINEWLKSDANISDVSIIFFLSVTILGLLLGATYFVGFYMVYFLGVRLLV